MKVGDIIRLKKEHYLSEIFCDNCIIDDIVGYTFKGEKKTRYHIRDMRELKWTWVSESEVDKISEVRNDKLKELGI
jgi:hypothetical protein